MTLDFDQMAARARAGDRTALGELHDALRPRIDALLRRYRRTREEGPLEYADLAQQAFLILAHLVHTWPGRGPFVAWFQRLFPLELLRYRRTLLRWDGPPVERVAPDDLHRLMEDRQPVGAADPSDEVFCRDLLSLLPAAYRRLLGWRFGDELTYRDIEHLHGVPAATAQVRCERALAYLREVSAGRRPRPLRAVSEEPGGEPLRLAESAGRLWAVAGCDGLLPPAARAARAVGIGRAAYGSLVSRLRRAGCCRLVRVAPEEGGNAAGNLPSRSPRRAGTGARVAWRLVVDLEEATRRLLAHG